MEKLRGESTILDFDAEGDPPDLYRMFFHGNGLVPDRDGGGAKIGKTHEALVSLGAQYPLQRPDVKWITPIVHPNIFGGTVCLGTFSLGWTPAVTLDEFAEVLWDMCRLAILNPHSAGPGGGEAGGQWDVLDRKYGFPVDKRPLRDKMLRSDEGSSIVRPEGAADDIVIIGDAPGICGFDEW